MEHRRNNDVTFFWKKDKSEVEKNEDQNLQLFI